MLRALKKKLRALALGPNPVPQLATVGRHSPQDEVRVLVGGLDGELDVTRSNVVVALRPLTLGLGVGDGHSLNDVKRKQLTLNFRQETRNGRLLGRIGLRIGNSRLGVCTSLPTTPHLVVGRSACRVGVGPSLNRSWAQRSRPVVQAGRRAFPGDESVVD